MTKYYKNIASFLFAAAICTAVVLACQTAQSATSQCYNDTASVKFYFKNADPNEPKYRMNVEARDSNTGKTVNLGTINPGETKNGVLNTGLSSINSGNVIFTITWANGAPGVNTATAGYNSISCKVEQPKTEEPKKETPAEDTSKIEKPEVIVVVKQENKKDDSQKKELQVTKKAKIQGKTDFENNIDKVGINDTVLFKIEVKNIGERDVKNISVEDLMPAEFTMIDGELTKDIAIVKDGEKFTYYITTKVNETNKSLNGDCVENQVKVKADFNDNGNKEKVDSDTTQVCFAKNIKELPATGAESMLAGLFGWGFAGLGLYLKRKN